jgi:hypothetical protein
LVLKHHPHTHHPYNIRHEKKIWGGGNREKKIEGGGATVTFLFFFGLTSITGSVVGISLSSPILTLQLLPPFPFFRPPEKRCQFRPPVDIQATFRERRVSNAEKHNHIVT